MIQVVSFCFKFYLSGYDVLTVRQETSNPRLKDKKEKDIILIHDHQPILSHARQLFYFLYKPPVGCIRPGNAFHAFTIHHIWEQQTIVCKGIIPSSIQFAVLHIRAWSSRPRY